VEKLAKEFDIRVAIHNHGPEDKHFPTPASVLDAVKNLDPRVGLCLDVGHSMRTGVDVVQSIEAAGSRLLDMHIKDLKKADDKGSQCDVGEGVMPVVAIFKQLKKMNYSGCVNLECMRSTATTRLPACTAPSATCAAYWRAWPAERAELTHASAIGYSSKSFPLS
jgi:sugar phosphate isomerase/epimerase